jgi:hypothetical protein
MKNNYENDELYKLMQPLLTAVSEYMGNPHKALENWEQQSEGILAWGVQSGYFLWVRQNPGKIPTMEQVWGWLQKGGLV